LFVVQIVASFAPAKKPHPMVGGVSSTATLETLSSTSSCDDVVSQNFDFSVSPCMYSPFSDAGDGALKHVDRAEDTIGTHHATVKALLVGETPR
jgi:hypothetical protein